MPIEAIIAVVFGVIGFVGWMTKVAFDLGQIRGMLKERLDALEKRVDGHSDTLKKHGTRITTIEASYE